MRKLSVVSQSVIEWKEIVHLFSLQLAHSLAHPCLNSDKKIIKWGMNAAAAAAEAAAVLKMYQRKRAEGNWWQSAAGMAETRRRSH
jgi:hypothetical protein